MARTDTITLAEAITDLRQRLADLPSINAGDSDSHRRNRAAEDDLSDYLAQTYGARIHRKAWTNTVRMLSIASSGTSGIAGALHNWISGATRRIEKLEISQ